MSGRFQLQANRVKLCHGARETNTTSGVLSRLRLSFPLRRSGQRPRLILDNQFRFLHGDSLECSPFGAPESTVSELSNEQANNDDILGLSPLLGSHSPFQHLRNFRHVRSTELDDEGETVEDRGIFWIKLVQCIPGRREPFHFD